jgi:hypothetical protein
MLDWILCRIKAGFFLLLFFLPIAVALWYQHLNEQLQASTSCPPTVPVHYVAADDPSDSDAP